MKESKKYIGQISL